MSLFWDDLSGGYFANPELSKQARIVASKQSRFYDVVTPGEDLHLGKNSGDSVAFKMWGRITGTATTALSENQKVPMVTPPEYTATAQVYQRGIAVPWSGLRQDLDRLDVESTVVHLLKEHSSRTHNQLIYDALIANRSFCYVATSATAKSITDNGTPSGTAASNLNGFHARQIALHMNKRNTPYFDGENYVLIGSPTLISGMFEDSTAVTGFVEVKKYTSSADGLLNGEVGQYHNLRMVKDNDVLGGSLDAIGSSSLYGSGVVCGLDACREIMVKPMELIAQMNLGGDFGRQNAIAWLSLLGYKTVWNYTSHGQGAVMHITSA